MNTIFIYYSYTGNGDVLAKAFEEKGIETRKLKPKKTLPKSFFFGMLAGGFRAWSKSKDVLIGFDDDIASFDHIILGSPIWNGRVSCPMNGALSRLDLAKKKVTFLFYSGSGEGKKALARIQKQYPSAEILFLQEPKKYPEQLTKIEGLLA